MAEFLEKLGLKSIDRLIGVDIGTSSIKLCVLNPGKNVFTLEHLVCKTYPEEIMAEGHIIDPFFVGEELKRIVKERKIKTKHAASAISSYSVISKYISIPVAEEEELEEAIKAEVEGVIPLPLNELYYAYYPLGFSQEKEDLMDVFIVAVKKGIVDDFKKTFEIAGLSLDVLDVDMLGVTNLIEEIYNPVNISIVAADIGSAITNIVIWKDGRIQFSREVLYGGNFLTKQIEKVSNLSFEEAEEKKMESNADVSYIFEDFVFNMVSEMKKTINFYLSTKPNENIGTIYLTGGSALVSGLKERMEEETKIEVQFIDPFKLISEKQDLKSYDDLRYKSTVAIYLSSLVRDIRTRTL